MKWIVLGICTTATCLLVHAATVRGVEALAQPRREVPPVTTAPVESSGRHLREALDPGDVPVAALDELASRTPIVVVGRTLGLRTRLAADRRLIATEVALLVQDSLRGLVPAGTVIYIRVPGGSHRLDTGQILTQGAAGFRFIKPATTYVLFLRGLSPVQAVSAGSAARVGRPFRAEYELAMGQQGQFELDFANDAVVPAAIDRKHPLMARYGVMAVPEFLSELRRVVLR